VPEGWSCTQSDFGLTLSGGQLLPGESLTVETSLKRYVEPGNRPYDVFATTTKGEVLSGTGALSIKEMILLKIIQLMSAYKVPILITTVSLGILETMLPSIMCSRKSVIGGQPFEPPKSYPEIPEDAPPPIIISEPKQKGAPKEYVIYVVSDLHMGSHLKYEVKKVKIPREKVKRNDWTYSEMDVFEYYSIDKSDSNLFSEDQATRFKNWLKSIDTEIEKDHPDAECHLIINGDFLDIWQAKMPSKIGEFETSSGRMDFNPLFYENRIDWILDKYIYRLTGILYYDEEEKYIKPQRKVEPIKDNPNYGVICELIRFASKRNRKIFYLIGNHDDPLYTGNRKNDPGYGSRRKDAEGLRNHFIDKIDGIRKKMGIPRLAMSDFQIGRYYWNRDWGVYAEHGHAYDEHNWKEKLFLSERKSSRGQKLVENYLLDMQESRVGSFRLIASEPYNLSVSYLECEYERSRKQGNKAMSDLIEKFVEDSAETLGYGGKEEIASTFSFRYITIPYLKKQFSEASMTADEDYGIYYQKSIELKDATKAAVLTFGHTHRPFCVQTSDSVYINTAEWIYNIKFEPEPTCRLEVDKNAYDYYLKIQSLRKLHDFEALDRDEKIEDYMRVELYQGPPYTIRCRYKVKKRNEHAGDQEKWGFCGR
jgi:UDP-2,3-diacylglucosamine pyrophosphatase LpxH